MLQQRKAHSNRTHMGTSQHGVDVNAQPEVLDHLRERMSETDEFPHHGVSAREKQEVLEQLKHSDGAGGCTSVRTVTIALEIFVDRTASIEGTLNRW